MSPYTLPVAALLCLASAANAQESDLQSWRATAARFEARTTELHDETAAFVDHTEARHRGQIESSYTPLVQRLERQEQSRRNLAIEALQDFLERYPSEPRSSHVRFRLAELFYEQSELQWHAATQAWEARVDQLPADAVAPPAPLLDLGPSIALYDRILSDEQRLSVDESYPHIDGVRFMWAWAHKDPQSAQFDGDLAHDGFATLVDAHPGSAFAPAAHLFLGNHAFDAGEHDDAAEHYEAVLAANQPRYEVDATYRLAWAHYAAAQNPDAYRRALDGFARVLELDEPDYHPEARRYIAISLVDMGDMSGVPPADLLSAWTAERSHAAWERDVALELGRTLEELARYDEAIELYTGMQRDPRWQNHPDNPALQARVVTLWDRVVFPDPSAQAHSREALVDRYGPGSAWWEHHRSDPVARESARQVVRTTLGDVAREQGIAALRTAEPEALLGAAARFDTYLQGFPLADDYEEMEWYLALTLAKGGQHAEAADHYEHLVRTRHVHPYGDGAVFEAVRAHFEAGDTAAFVAAAERALGWNWSSGPQQDTDYAAALQERRGEILYALGQAHHTEGRFEAARSVLHEAIGAAPGSQIENDAAQLIVKSYADEGDLESVAKWSRAFRPIDRRGEFLDALHWAEFRACADLSAESDLSGASCYASYAAAFQDSEFYDEALLNAANRFATGGDHGASAEALATLLQHDPNHPRAEAFRWRIATAWESQFELERASAAYLDLVQRHPHAKAAPDALFNAALALAALGDTVGAARTFERYGEEYGHQDDAEAVGYRAGEQWAKVGAQEERRFWERHLRRWPDASADHQLVALARLADIAEGAGKTRTRDHHYGELLDRWHQLVRSGTPIGREGRAVAGSAAYRALEPMLAEIEGTRLTGDEGRDAELLLDTLPTRVAALDEAGIALLDYGDATTSLAALYTMGRGHMALADTGYGVKCPDWMTDDEREACEEVLDETIRARMDAHQDKAVQLWQKVVATAERLGVHDGSVDDALDALNDVDPRSHPARKVEKRPVVDLELWPEIAPLRLADAQ